MLLPYTGHCAAAVHIALSGEASSVHGNPLIDSTNTHVHTQTNMCTYVHTCKHEHVEVSLFFSLLIPSHRE
jgi:hypothetical protein